MRQTHLLLTLLSIHVVNHNMASAHATVKCQGQLLTKFFTGLPAIPLYRFASLRRFSPPPPTIGP